MHRPDDDIGSHSATTPIRPSTNPHATGSDGAMWFTQGNDSIGRITTSGAVTTYTDTSLNHPRNIIAGPDGALWFVNQGDNTIGRITTSGAFSSFAGDGRETHWPGDRSGRR